MKKKPDINDFLDGSAADRAEKPSPVKEPAPKPSAKIPKEQKLYRLSVDVVKALKTAAFEQSMETGGRVTETEIVEAAIRKYLDI